MSVNVQILADQNLQITLQKKNINGVETLVEYIHEDGFSTPQNTLPPGNMTLFFRDTQQNPLPQATTRVKVKDPSGVETWHNLTYDGILILEDLSIGDYQIIKVENTAAV